MALLKEAKTELIKQYRQHETIPDPRKSRSRC